MKKPLFFAAVVCFAVLMVQSAFAGVDPGTRDSVWFVPELITWNGDTSFATAVYTLTDESLEQATIILTWSSSEMGIDSVSLAGSRWQPFVDGDSGVFVATQGMVGGVPSPVHYNISFLPFGSLLSTGSGPVCTIHWSNTVNPVTVSSIDIDSSTTTSGVNVVNSTLFGTSGLPSGNFVPAFSGVSITVIPCSCPLQGDFNADTAIDPVDLSRVIDIVFFGSPNPQDSNCPGMRADLNCDGLTDAVDVSFMVDLVFFGGPTPCDPCNCTPYPGNCP